MADRLQTTPTTGSDASMTGLLSGIVNDAQELIKQQLDLFKHELKDDMKRAQEALPSLGLGVVVAMAAVFLLGMTIANLLSWAIPPLPLWVAYAITTVVFGVVGGVLLYFAKKNLESLPMSRQAADATKENVEWLTKPK
jgi:uncharacterized membrane protein YqjE